MPGVEKLGLGTAQFGLDYGVSNTRGRTPPAEVAAILREADAAGVRVVDTAPSYGAAEETLGWGLPARHRLRLVTKTVLGADAETLEREARASLKRMRVKSADTLLAHAPPDLRGSNGAETWGAMQRLRDEGLYRRIGFSAYLGQDPVALAKTYRPDVVQLPVSLLDQRLIADGTLETLAEMGVEIHLRSIFLQGLLFVPLERLPGRLEGSAGRIRRARLALQASGVDMVTAAVRFALERPEASCAVVGVTGMDEFRAVLAAAAEPTPDLDWSAFALDDEVALDPRRWAA